jgi:ribosomal protein L32
MNGKCPRCGEYKLTGTVVERFAGVPLSDDGFNGAEGEIITSDVVNAVCRACGQDALANHYNEYEGQECICLEWLPLPGDQWRHICRITLDCTEPAGTATVVIDGMPTRACDYHYREVVATFG